MFSVEGEVVNKADFGHRTVSVSSVRLTCHGEAVTDDMETNRYGRVQIKLSLQKRADLAQVPHVCLFCPPRAPCGGPVTWGSFCGGQS